MQPLTTVFISIQAVKAPVLHGAGNQRRPNIAGPGHDMYQISVDSDIYHIYQVPLVLRHLSAWTMDLFALSV